MTRPIPPLGWLLKNRLAEEVAALRTERTVEVWAMDEHRVGLKPILRRVWARKGQRPGVCVRPRYEWLYVYGFVCPETGQTEFWLTPSVNTETFTRITEAFLRGRYEAVLMVLDQAGWHVSAETLAMEGERLKLKHLPSHSPGLMPAERLWTLTDEPLANRVFERLGDLEEVLAERCVALTDEPERIRSLTLYHWWPGGADETATCNRIWYNTARRRMLEGLVWLRADEPEFAVHVANTSGFTLNDLHYGTGDQREILGKDAYSEAMINAKVCLVPRGTSPETYRYFEVLRYGTITIVERQPPFPFYDGAPVVDIDDWADCRPSQPQCSTTLTGWRSYTTPDLPGGGSAAPNPPSAR